MELTIRMTQLRAAVGEAEAAQVQARATWVKANAALGSDAQGRPPPALVKAARTLIKANATLYEARAAWRRASREKEAPHA